MPERGTQSEICQHCGQPSPAHTKTCPAYTDTDQQDNSNVIDATEIIREKQNNDYRQRTSAAIVQLTKSRVSIVEIAHMIGASDFIMEKKHRKQEPTVHFDIQGFIDHQIETGTYLQIPSGYQHIDTVIIPPDEGKIRHGDGPGPEREHIPRSKYLREVLSELGEQYTMLEGITPPNIVRGESYVMYHIIGLDKLVMVNDESGNRTFIIHNFSDSGKDISEVIAMDKEALKTTDELQVDQLIYHPDPDVWKQKITTLLLQEGVPVPTEQDTDEKRSNPNIAETPGSPPDEWMSMIEMAELTDRDPQTLRALVADYRESNPEWFRQYRTHPQSLTEYIHPDCMEIIVSEYSKYDKAPEGWKKLADLANDNSRYYQSISFFIERFRSEHPEWFHQYESATHHIREYMHPDLVALTEKQFSERQSAPDGWENASNLREILQRAHSVFMPLVEQYRTDHSEWFQQYDDLMGRPTEYFHPDLVKSVRDSLSTREKAPEGWESTATMAQQLDRSMMFIARTAAEFRAKNSEWFYFYENNSGRVTEHFHPDLVEEIRHTGEKREAPAGWMIISQLAQEIKVARPSIIKITDQYRASHPEWFQGYSRGGKVREHFHPELTSIVKQELEEERAEKVA